jgi:hypothetical protein
MSRNQVDPELENEMLFATLLQHLRRRPKATGGVPQKRWAPFQPSLDLLEDRTLLSAVGFSLPVDNGPGSAVAVGDFNGDGNSDLAVVNGNTVRILQGNGDGTFHSVGTYTVSAELQSIAVGDFNGDGKLDLAVTDLNIGAVSVLMGNGDGTFQAAQNYAVGSEPVSIAVGDFNGDGKPDMAVANGGTNQGNGSVSVLLNNGDGTFGTAVNYPTGYFPRAVAVGDFNGDGNLDLAVANEGTSTVTIMLGNGAGSFPTSHSFLTGPFRPSPVALAVGDFNGDGKSDVAVVNLFANNVCVMLSNGDGTLQTPVPYPTGGSPSGVAVGDFNGDGKPDLVVTNEIGQNVSLLQGNGDGTFTNSGTFNTGTYPLYMAEGDFNGDGRPDLAISGDEANVLLNEIGTTTTLSGPTSSTYGRPDTYTATVTSNGAPETAGTVTFLANGTPISPALPLDGNGQASFTISTLRAWNYTINATYSGTPDGAGTTGIAPSSASTTLAISPFVLSGSAVNFSATAGAPFTGTIATFTNPIPFGDTAYYDVSIDWGDGSVSGGTITSGDTLVVSGFHTYAAPGNYPLTVGIYNILGDTTEATVYPTVTVTTLGHSVQDGLTGGIGFWHNKNGQVLINAFNGGPDSTSLSYWLAATLPHFYGNQAGYFWNVGGWSNAQIAAFYQSQFAMPGSNLQVEVLATALNVYATTLSLGGTTGQAYGFTVTATGLGADSFNVGADGAAVGVANNTTLNVYELLQGWDLVGYNAIIYTGDSTVQKEANDLFETLNREGAIS